MKNKKIFIKATIIFIIIVNIFISLNQPLIAIEILQTIKVGLYYNDAKTQSKSALSEFKVSALKGLILGFDKNNIFTEVHKETTSNNISVLKDVYSYAPYHIKIGDSFNDINLLNQKIDEYQKKGVSVFKSYTGVFEIWTGSYLSSEGAQVDVLQNIIPKLGPGNYSIINPSDTRIIITSFNNANIFAFDNNDSIFKICPDDKNIPYIFKINDDDKKRFRGQLEIRMFPSSNMTLINVLPLEEYLYGVVPYEIGASSPMEALKAQAVCARTYVLNNLKKYEYLGFNVCTTQYSQVYKGFYGESQSTNKAVNDTASKIVTYNNKPAQVFYFSSSGGMTENVKNVWGSEFPYLKSVEDKYETDSTWNYSWNISFETSKIKQLLNSKGIDIGDILGFEITKLSEAGRVVELVIKGKKGNKTYKNEGTRTVLGLDSQLYIISTNSDVFVQKSDLSINRTQINNTEIMTSSGIQTILNPSFTVLGANNLKKNVSRTPSLYTFTGKGWGHAVGMSQNGAIGMAKAGFTFDKILTHYFTGTKLE